MLIDRIHTHKTFTSGIAINTIIISLLLVLPLPTAYALENAVLASYDDKEISVKMLLSHARKNTGSGQDWKAMLRSMAFNDSTDIARLEYDNTNTDYANLQKLTHTYVANHPEYIKQANDQQVDDYYALHQNQQFTQSEYRLVYFIYKKGDDQAGLINKLNTIIAKRPSHITFPELASLHSESDTKMMDGSIGWVTAGQLTKSADELVFSLAPRTISQAIALPGGAGVFFVEEIRKATTYSLQDMKKGIKDALSAKFSLQFMIEDITLTEQQMLTFKALTEEDFVTKVNAIAEPSEILLSVCNRHLSKAAFEIHLQETTPKTTIWDPPTALTFDDQIWLEYLRLFASYKIVCSLDNSENFKPVDQHLDPLEIFKKMSDVAQQSPQALIEFHQQNQALFQSQPTISISIASVSAQAYIENPQTYDLDSSYKITDHEKFMDHFEKLGFQIIDLNQMPISNLKQYFSAKSMQHISPLEPGTNSSLFQSNGFMNVVYVMDKSPGRPLDYESAQAAVLKEYVRRNQEVLYTKLVEATLIQHDFKIHEPNLNTFIKNW